MLSKAQHLPRQLQQVASKHMQEPQGWIKPAQEASCPWQQQQLVQEPQQRLAL